MKNNHENFMRRALWLAEKQGRYASPNPKVGALLVKKGRIVGEGGHRQYGGPHAEIIALRQAGAEANGATLYITLEPCSHHGKTPPCVDAILKAGVRKVVAAMKDPFPLVGGRGFQRLRKAGIDLEVGLLQKEARRINEPFLFSVHHHRPLVLLKAAMSLDGKIATVTGRSKWITGEKARRKAHELRARVDAILIGKTTALKDDPSLTVRLPGFGRNDGWPMRVVLDSKLQLNPEARLFDRKAKTIVFASPSASVHREKAFKKRGIPIFRVPSPQKMLSLKAVLRILDSLYVRSLLVEGGGEVHASFLREGLVDKVALFISPKILGGKAPTWMGGKGVENPNLAPYLKNVRLEKLGADLLMTGHL
jgi:diaminohydroxyphosphoribosylaminopyrimidine deaminase / 5-amino-6-(5-phosphoribosylamino)uracil reductase